MIPLIRTALLMAATFLPAARRPSRMVPAGTAAARGLTVMEYVLMAGLIVVILAVVGLAFKETLIAAFNNITDAFNGVAEEPV